MAVTRTGDRPLERELWWMVGPAGGRSGATTNVQSNRSIRPWRFGEAHLVIRCDGRRFLDFASQRYPLGSTTPRPDGTVTVQTSTNLYRRQQAPPTRRYLNDGATGALPAPTSVGTCVDPTKPRITRESNMLGSTLPSREPVKRRTSRLPSSATTGHRTSVGFNTMTGTVSIGLQKSRKVSRCNWFADHESTHCR